MPPPAVSTANLPLGSLVDVLGHVDAGGGALAVRRMAVGELANVLRGLISGSPGALATVQAALAAETEARRQAVAGVQGNLDNGLDAEVKARVAAIARLTEAVGPSTLAALSTAGRPGDLPTSYTLASMVGALAGPDVALPGLPADRITTSDAGAVCRIVGGGIVASRRAIALELGRTYLGSFAFQRRANSSDPANDTVRAAILWMDQARNVLPGANAFTVVNDWNALVVSDGRVQFQARFARLAGAGLVVAPVAARYARLLAWPFGVDGVTDISLLHDADVTDAAVLDPISANVAAQVAALYGLDLGPRVSAVESQLQAPNSLTFASRGDAVSANIPASATTLALRGSQLAGDGRDGLYARVDALPAGADGFSSQDSAKWLRVPSPNDFFYVPDQRSVRSDQDRLTAAIAYCMDAGSVLMIHRPYALTSNISFPCPVRFGPRGRLTKAAGAATTPAVSFSAELVAGPWQIFDAALKIDLSQARCEYAAYEWWGAVGDKNPGNGPGLPDATAAINAAWACGHNYCRGAMRSYRHTGTLFARNEKTTYGPPLGSLLTEMWFDDPTGTKDAVIVQSASGGSVYGAVLGEHSYIRMQRATAGCAVWMVYAVDIEVGGLVYASAGPSDPRWYRGIGIGPKCQDVHLDRMRGIGACVSAGVYGNITNPDDLVNGVYLPDAYIRDCPNNVSLYGYIIGIFSFPKTLNYNGLSTCYALGSPVRSGMNVVKIQGGDIDTGGTGLYASNVGSLSVTCWVATFAKCMTLKDCDNLVIDLTQLYPAGASAEGIEVQGCIGGSISIGAASGGLYVIRVRASDVTGLGNRLSAHLPSCSYQQYGIIDNSNPPGTGARFVVWQVGYLSANVATAPDPTGTFLDIVAARAM